MQGEELFSEQGPYQFIDMTGVNPNYPHQEYDFLVVRKSGHFMCMV